MYLQSNMSKRKEQKKPRKQASRKKKTKVKPKPPKEIDMVKFKKKILEEMANAIPSKYIILYITNIFQSKCESNR